MRPDLFFRQKSAWNGFAFDLADATGTVLVALELANFAQARNARLRVHPPGSTAGDCHIQLGAERLLSRFEYGLSLPQASQPVQAFLLVATYLVQQWGAVVTAASEHPRRQGPTNLRIFLCVLRRGNRATG